MGTPWSLSEAGRSGYLISTGARMTFFFKTQLIASIRSSNSPRIAASVPLWASAALEKVPGIVVRER